MVTAMSDALTYLVGLEIYGIKFGLDNIRTMTDALGKPQDSYPSIIVAGTNGKGSASAMVAASLRAAGHRTGCYTSPHLVDIEERFAIDGTPVSREELEEVVTALRELVDRLIGDGSLRFQPTFFEITTAAAFELFRRRSVDIAVLEVGLGGRLDATNISESLVAAITSIDIDHERFLGRTLREIAFEKAGVIKPGMAVVAGERKPDALDVIAEACRSRGARLIRSWDGVQVETVFDAGRAHVEFTTPRRTYPPCTLALRGRHQVENALVAVRTLEALEEAGVTVGPEAIASGLRTARWQGRLQLIQLGRSRQVLIDAAHNPAGARSLALYLGEVYPDGVPLVFAVMEDKDRRGMLEALLPHATRVVLTRAPTPRSAAPADVLADVQSLRPDLRVDIETDPLHAVDVAMSDAPVACVAGSIFLLGALLPLLESTPGNWS
jgi:dihydrofolate synthase/folylpolyglutamate synthase